MRVIPTARGVLLATALVTGLVTALATLPSSSAADGEDPLFVYCCAGFRPPIEAVASAFRETHGIEVDLTFAGSGCLVAQAELAGRGDLFLPGEEHYMTKAQERSLIREVASVAYLRPVIAVRAGNPHGIRDLEDLAQPGLRVGLGDPRSVAVGIAAQRWFESDLGEDTIAAIESNTITRAINVNELGNQLALGGIEAAIVWDVTVPLFEGLEAVVPAGSIHHRTIITGGVLEMSRQKQNAAAFLRFLTGPRGREILTSFAYEPFVDDDETAHLGSPR